MNIKQIKKLSKIMEIISSKISLSDIEIDIETIEDRLYILTEEYIATDIQNCLLDYDFNIADDYMNGEERTIKLSLKL
jgi:hypothetical protein